MLDSASEVELESDSSSIEGSKDALATNEQLSRRVDSLQQENRVLKTEVETLKLKIKGLNETIQQLRRNSVNIQARAEQEEEFISNTLLKKITELKKEKESLALNYEQEEECLTNELNRKFTQLRQEKVALERTLAREQEDQVSKLKSRIEKLETDMNNKQECLDRLRREKIELENALEQEQEALVNRLWKKMETLETEKKTLQEKLESLGAMLSASSSNQSIASVSHPTSTDGSLPSAPVISTGAISNSRPTSSGPGSLRAQSRPSVTTHSLSPPHTSTEASTRPLIPHSLLFNTVALSSSDARSQLNQSASIPTDSALPKTSPSGPHPIPPQSPMDVDHSDHPQSERTSPLRPDRLSQPHKLFITDSKQFEAEEPKRNQLLKGSVADWDANTTAAYVNRLREEVRHLRQLLEKYEAETATKMVMYESEERSAIEENRRLRKLLQIEKERREALSRHLSESESSLEMEDERHFNEACRNPRLRTTSDSAFHPPTHLTNVSMIYGPGHAYAAAVAAGLCTSQPSSASSRICHECGQRLLPLWEESSAPVTGSPSVRSPPTSLHTTNLPRPPHGPCCSPGKSCGHHHVSLPNSPATPTTSPGSLSAAFAKPSSMRAPVSTSDRNSFPMDSRDGFFEKIPSPYCSSEQLFISGDFANNDDAADADDDDDARCATPPVCPLPDSTQTK